MKIFQVLQLKKNLYIQCAPFCKGYNSYSAQAVTLPNTFLPLNIQVINRILLFNLNIQYSNMQMAKLLKNNLYFDTIFSLRENFKTATGQLSDRLKIFAGQKKKLSDRKNDQKRKSFISSLFSTNEQKNYSFSCLLLLEQYRLNLFLGHSNYLQGNYGSAQIIQEFHNKITRLRSEEGQGQCFKSYFPSLRVRYESHDQAVPALPNQL